MGKPKIRFKGYTEDWEQRKVGDYYEFKNGLNKGKEFFGMGTPIVNFTDVFHKRGLLVSDLQGKVTLEQKEIDNFLVKKGDIFFTRTSETVEEIGYPSVMLESPENTVFSGFVLRGRTFLEQDPLEDVFKKYVFFTDSFRKEMMSKSSMTTRALTSGTAIKNMVFYHPLSKEEQKKIGDYFSKLDNLITLHQRKCDETKKLKKCMLQKMFPKEGEKVPEIRFSGFTGDWKQRKLGEIVNRLTRKNSKLISELPLTISAQQGLIDQNEFFDKRVASKDVSGYYLIKNGEFAYNKSTSNDAPWGAIKRLDCYENGVLSTLYIVFEIKDETLVNSDFLVAYYNTNLWHKGIHEIAAEGARNHGLLNIAPTDFFKTKLKLPADIEEQQEIGEYFKKIDSIITFHQQKCDELKNIKKFMLQNMFVSEK